MSFVSDRPPLLSQLPLDGDAVIEASAGTGKTYTIENLVVDRLLRSDTTIEQMLIVTFTKKATAELKSRIRGKIESLLTRWNTGEHDPTEALEQGVTANQWLIDETARRKLEAALFSFDHGAVFTIHGFCNRVLQELAFQTGQLFENELVDEKAIFFKAYRQVLREYIAAEPTPRALLNSWLENGKNAGALGRLLYRAHAVRLMTDRPDPEVLKRELAGLISMHFDRGRLEDELNRARLSKAATASAKEVADRLHGLDVSADADAWMAALDDEELSLLSNPKHAGKRTDVPREFPADMSPATQALITELRRYQSVEEMSRCRELEVIEAFLPPVLESLEALKLRDGLFTYDDVLDRIVDALDGPSGDALLTALRSRYHLALIDEFQDTDRRQWAIFNRVFGESQAHSLCVIGDPKQAIYGFRGAEVYTYLRACEALCERPDSPAVKLPLDTCFRSSQGLIDGVNLLVGEDRDGAFFDRPIVYDIPVKCGRPSYALTRGPAQEPEPAITLWKCTPKLGKKGPALGAKDIGPPLARQLAESLRRLIQDPEHTLYWHDGEANRALGAGDVMVLVRTKNESAEVGNALRRVGVPFIALQSDDVFQSKEALYLRDLLASLGSPGHDGRQMAALVTPFFGVPLEAGYRYAQLSGDHPYATRLQRWRFLAEQGYFGQLFAALQEDSGVVARALFGDEDAQALTNIQHLLERLTEEVAERRLSLTELIQFLDERSHDSDGAGGGEDAKLRAAADGTAVQILTIHKSKGLEAPVVCVYGDYGAGQSNSIELIHVNHERRFLVGDAMKKAYRKALHIAQRSEAQRLHYVAMTRAKVKLFLPFIDTEAELPGDYEVVNGRLARLHRSDRLEATRFQLDPVTEFFGETADDQLETWTPPTALLDAASEPSDFGALYQLRAAHAPLVMTSYTRLKDQGVLRSEHVPLEAEEFKEDPSPTLAPDLEALEPDRRLPGGRHMGRCLHEIIELIDFGDLAPFETWRTEAAVDRTVTWALKRHDIDPFWRSQCEELVYGTVTRTVPLPDEVELPPFTRMREIRELEFLFPIPENHHPLLSRGAPPEDADWTVDRGFIKGFIDLVFEHDGRVYWADWKSDTLPQYDSATLTHHVRGHYDTQAQLYTLGMVRLLGITDEESYERRFGGLLYIFLRGFAQGEGHEGVYFERPSWATVCVDEQRLEKSIPGWGRR